MLIVGAIHDKINIKYPQLKFSVDKLVEKMGIDLETIWNNILVSAESILSKSMFEALSASGYPVSIESGMLVVGTENEFLKEWLSQNCTFPLNKFLDKNTIPGVKEIKFVVAPPPPTFYTQKEEIPPPKISTPSSPRMLLNPRYTFESFVVGHGNRFAHAAALAVAEAPAKAYNPLFIYGGVGLGKTHLMQAIGHHGVVNHPTAKVLYVTAEKFTNELINAIRYDKMVAFREEYRGIDILLVDDIQFFAGKERSQEEFFHTFNALHDASKQLVISSDHPPKEIPSLEERLRSRFEWGLTADIQPPDLETRIAILKKKAEIVEISLPDEVLNSIASLITSNIRELEGALIKVIAHAALIESEITVATTENILKDILSPIKEKPAVTIDLIKRLTADYYSIKLEDMSAKIRTKEIANARQVAMYLSRELTSFSLPKIGEEFGGRDHTTVMHACEKIKEEIKNNSEIKEDVEKITSKIKKLSKM